MIKLTNKKFYITTAIPYVNAEPHLGHALEFVQTDILKRFHELLGEEVFLVTGADENSLKNVQAAEKQGMETREFCDKYSRKFEEFSQKINLSFNCFRRSSDKEKHWKGVYDLWNKCSESGDIYKKKYKGLYCVGCESFYTENELEDGLCPEHKKKPEIIEEENYFFKLSKYEEKLRELIEEDEYKIYPEFRKKEVLEFIKGGLEDFSISRSVERAKGWGVPVPEDDSQIMYVWFDALSCYITGVGYGYDEKLFEKWWPCKSHIIGKGITRFHAIYWPAMLLSAGVELPKSLFIHGYITVEGQKMSKSLGNVLDPMELIEKYGTDQIRYYLIKEIPNFHDGDFSEKRLVEKINNELVANIGNLVNRTLVFVRNNFEGNVPKSGKEKTNKKEKILEKQKKKYEKVKELLNNFEIREALEEIMLVGNNANKYFQDLKPWELVKKDKKKCGEVLYDLLVQVRDIAILLHPYLPDTSKKIFSMLNVKPANWNNLGKLDLKEGHELNEPEILFQKIKIKEKETKIESGKKNIKKEKIKFSDLDIEVAEVIRAGKHPDAEKLFIEVVQLKDGQRQIVSGLADYYKFEDLIGKKVVILKNLKPAKIRGVLSQGMLLVSEGKEGLEILECRDCEIGDNVHLENETNKPKKEITFQEFSSLNIEVKNGEIFSEGKKVFAGKEGLKAFVIKNGNVR